MKIRRFLTKGNRHIRKELNLLWDFVMANTLVDGLPGWSRTPQGLIPPREPGTYIPLSPIVWKDSLGVTTCRVTRGWVRGPIAFTSGSNEHEIPKYHLGEVAVTVGGADNSAADSTSNLLTFTDGQTNNIYMEIDVTLHQSTIGETDLGTGNVGHTVLVSSTNSMPTESSGVVGSVDITGVLTGVTDSHTHNVPDHALPAHTHSLVGLDHQHVAMGSLSNLTYTISTADILVTTGDPPDSTELTHVVKMGKWVLDTAGATTDWEWYQTGNLDYFPPQYTVSNITSGHVIDGTALAADDRSINPRDHNGT